MISHLDLPSFLETVRRRVGRANTVTIGRAAEVKALAGLGPDELRALAARHHLRVVCRLGGSQFEFTPLPPDP